MTSLLEEFPPTLGPLQTTCKAGLVDGSGGGVADADREFAGNLEPSVNH
jgi:hypothetical protein